MITIVAVYCGRCPGEFSVKSALALESLRLVPPARLGDLENRLQAHMGRRVRNLEVIFHERGIVLRGMAQTYHAKQVAQHALMAETDVPIAANEIEVH